MIKAQFKGTQIVPKDAVFPEIGELRGDFGKEVLAEYEGRAKSDYGNADALNVLSYSNGVVIGSNPFATVLINQIVRANGLRTATPADLEKALSVGIDLSEGYSDSALVLRSVEEPNKYLAENLANQIKARGNKKYLAMIPLNGLELVKDASSPHGLAFQLREDANIIYASILGKDTGNFNSEDINLAIGLPERLGNGNRTLYTRKSGLSWLYLARGSGLYSDIGDLADSNESGRVRLTSASQGAKSAKNLAQYVANLEKAKAEEIAKIEQRFGKAMNILTGN